MTNPDKPQRSNRPLLIIIIVLLLVIGCGGAVPVVGILAAIAIPNFVVYQLRAKRTEVPLNVDGIRAAELAYHAAFDAVLPVPHPVPLDPLMVDRMAVDWPYGTPFDELGWSPDGQVRGTYWVEVAPDGSDFVVHGVCDLDGDGAQAHYTATKELRATMESWSDVY